MKGVQRCMRCLTNRSIGVCLCCLVIKIHYTVYNFVDKKVIFQKWVGGQFDT